jgi:hypothetical protein
VRFLGRRREDLAGLRIGLEGFAFLAAERLQLIHHQLVACLDRLGLHHAVE